MAPPLTRGQTLSYSLGQFAWAAKDVSFHYFLFFYYSQFQGLSPSLAGLAALIALVADGISDPLIGQISDSWRGGKQGRRHPFMLGAIIPFIICLLAIFDPPDGLSQGALFTWYLVLAIMVRTFLTLFTVPHMAMGAELSADYSERTRIATLRTIMGYIGGLTIQVVAWFIVIPAATRAGDTAAGYQQVSYVASALALLGMLVAWYGTRARIPYLQSPSETQQGRAWWKAFGDIASLFKVHSARIMFLGTFLLVLQMGMSATLLLHVNNFFWGFSSEQTGVFMLTVFFALFPAFWLATRGTERLGKRRCMVYFIVFAASFQPIIVMAHLFGLTPAAGSNSLLLVVCLFIVVGQSFAIAALNVSGALLPDVADEVELHNGMRQEGILNSGIMLIQKVMFGLGTFFAGLVIDYTGLGGITDIADVTDTMFNRLGWIYGPGTSIIAVLGALIFTRYRLDRTRLAEVQSAIAARSA